MPETKPRRPSRSAALKVNEPLKKRATLAECIGAKPMPNGSQPALVYALKAWSVKKVPKGWVIAETAHFDDRQRWRGPYKTLRHATTAIARLMEAEATERHRKLCAHHNIEP